MEEYHPLKTVDWKQAKREYICFIDSDDWVDVDYLSAMINNLKKETDLIILD